jgi:hypothetical protein
MNQSLISKFQAIDAILLLIKQSSEWTEYAKTDRQLNECTFSAIEEAVDFFLENGKLTDSTKEQEQFPEFESESEDAATPFIWDLIDG